MGNRKLYIVFVFALTAVSGCRKPYTPAAITSTNNYMVVEGVINNGSDSTVIKLSKTVTLSSKATSSPVSGALVEVQAEGGSVYPLVELASLPPGQYLAVALNLDKTKKYRLHINTEGKDYLSDYVVVKPTPPIDSVTYQITSKGLQINSNTHDATNNTRYYRQTFEESWKFHAFYNSSLIVKNGDIVSRTDEERIYYCYKGDKSSHIVLASSQKLKEDVIYNNPVTLIPPSSEKLTIRYSIKVKQYALTKEAYDFWENIKKNTEQLGGIFDAQPSQLKGNIHNVANPAEAVIGYVSISTVETKRIFIDNKVFPNTWFVPNNTGCEILSALLKNNSGENEVEVLIIKGGLNPVDAIFNPNTGKIIGYRASTFDCTDCTLKGTVTAPDFWEF